MFYTADFRYRRDYQHNDEIAANQVLGRAEADVEKILKNNKIKYKHAYSWPDGALKYIESDLPLNELQDFIQKAIDKMKGYVTQVFVSVASPDENPFKFGCNTLAQYMKN